jgi:hypothetical protein
MAGKQITPALLVWSARSAVDKGRKISQLFVKGKLFQELPSCMEAFPPSEQ